MFWKQMLMSLKSMKQFPKVVFLLCIADVLEAQKQAHQCKLDCSQKDLQSKITQQLLDEINNELKCSLYQDIQKQFYQWLHGLCCLIIIKQMIGFKLYLKQNCHAVY
ncbi:unnamed protein product (macronuclear) [Paramecium tetraurelia]|uniref:Secreted protein n=1 Tax=Paramecium tetraurelia TaxID=5888 RepID=A0E1P1_PARTE|nr:uncharacterized protein GSPATT00022379001 [Paramecium tetraurelia]CAK89208.1 unnamed protein product [Paramecium tetraurelia]|eukprot:XP_001456605.1 hypothetical protein (macronuclear) [Paramecium tetraurelia strain d4-2]